MAERTVRRPCRTSSARPPWVAMRVARRVRTAGASRTIWSATACREGWIMAGVGGGGRERGGPRGGEPAVAARVAVTPPRRLGADGGDPDVVRRVDARLA